MEVEIEKRREYRRREDERGEKKANPITCVCSTDANDRYAGYSQTSHLLYIMHDLLKPREARSYSSPQVAVSCKHRF